MGTSGASETFFVVASTDLQQSGVMTARMREQLERGADLKAKCALTISTLPIELPPDSPTGTLEQQVQSVADRVSQMIMTTMERKQLTAGKSAQIPTN
jgi:hypothetical protein